MESGASDGAAAHDGSQPLHRTAVGLDGENLQGLVAEELVSVAAIVDVLRQNGRRPWEMGAKKEGLRKTLLMDWSGWLSSCIGDPAMSPLSTRSTI